MLAPLRANIDICQRLLRKLKSDESAKKLVQVMLVSSQMIMLHANDLLDQRIIENGHFVPNMTSGSIKETVAEMIDLMNSTLEFKNLKIILTKNENYIPKFAKYDKRRLQQVLLNLLSNAVKYSQKGTILVSM